MVGEAAILRREWSIGGVTPAEVGGSGASLGGAKHSARLLLLCLVVAGVGASGCAPEPDGAAVFAEHCATCHVDPLFPRALPLDMMVGWNPELILTALTSGPMEVQGQALTAGERSAVARYISAGGPEADPAR